MDVLSQIENAGKEISLLKGKIKEHESLKKKYAKEKEEVKSENELWDFILPFICPEEIERIRTLSKKKDETYLDEEKIKNAKKYLKRPNALGYKIVCTCEDTAADSGGDESEYDMFLLTDDGKAIHVSHLGLYQGHSREEIPSARETIIRKFFREIKNVEKEAPMCAKAVSKLHKKI